LTALVLAAAAGIAAAQEKAPEKTPPAKDPGSKVVVTPMTPGVGQPKGTITTTDGRLNFEKTDHEFGTISDDKPVEAEFKFTNGGTGPLEITNTQGSCGCTVGTLEKKIYAPGEAGTIKVSFNPAHKRGPQHTTVTVSSNDATRPQLVLNIKSDVKPMVMVDPQVAMLNQIPKGKGGSTQVTITSRIPGLTIVNATPSAAYFDTKLGEAKELEVNGEKVTQWVVDVSARPDAPVGPVSAGVSIRTSDANRLLNFTVTGEVVGDIVVTPPRIQLPPLQPGQAISAQVTLKSRNGKAFKATKVDDLSGATKVLSTIDLKEDATATPPSYTLTVAGAATEQPGAINGTLIVRTDIPGEEEIKIPYFGYVRATTAQPAPAAKPKPKSVWDENPSSLVPDPR
jgi:hypothetical protein